MSSPEQQRFWEAAEFAGKFFMGTSKVHEALSALVAVLEAEKIPYAIAGAMALNAHGYRRVTEDVDVLLTPDGLTKLKAAVLGRGYVEKFAGSKGMRDTIHNVAIDVLLSGDYPGDGKPKAVRFPEPSVGEARNNTRVLPLPKLVELKLASGISAPHRLKDLADVLELIKAARLPRELGAQLDASVREKFYELWDAAQAIDAFHEE